MKLVFLGPPGSGKGTQAELMSKKLGIPHISTGDIFRENMKKKTELGEKAKALYDKGILIPDNITNKMVKDRLSQNDCKKGYILDGYPRTIPQAEFLASIQKLDKVINFILDDNEVLKRILGRAQKSPGRADDSPQIIKKRIDEYKKKTEPLINYYKNKSNIVDIDASPSIQEISKKVQEVLPA